MRTPEKIEQFIFPEGDILRFSKDKFLEVLDSTVEKVLKDSDQPGILLSGGVDSSLLVILAVKYYSNIPCFVIGQHLMSPDVQAAMRLAKEKELNLYVHLLNLEEILSIQQELIKCGNSIYLRDDCVLAALKFASPFVNTIIATDGIDELMGGYWGHRDRKRFPEVKNAFKYFWDELEEKHLSPMSRSAKLCELDLVFVYLFSEVIQHLSMIPLEDRIKGGIGKAIWKEIALRAGVPLWVIERKKEGFVDALK